MMIQMGVYCAYVKSCNDVVQIKLSANSYSQLWSCMESKKSHTASYGRKWKDMHNIQYDGINCNVFCLKVAN